VVIAVGGSLEAVVVNGLGESQIDVFLRPMQSAWIDDSGARFIGGAGGVVFRMLPGSDRWQRVPPSPIQPEPQSFGAMFHDGNQLWVGGGTVLTPPRDRGVLVTIRADVVNAAPLPRIEPPPPPTPVCPPGRANIAPTASMARRVNELLLDAIRRDLPQPGVHARNLFHISAAIYDAWAAYEPTATGYISLDKATGDAADRDEAIAYAGHRVLLHRYRNAIGGPVTLVCADDFLTLAGYDPTNVSTAGTSAAATGNRIGQAIIDAFANDGANEANNYADTTNYMPINPPMLVDGPGTTDVIDPDVFQELSLVNAVSQNGIPVPAGAQRYVGPNWANVTPFALPDDDDADGVRLATPTPPTFASAAMKDYVIELLTKSAELDHTDGATIDVAPSAIGNNELGTNNGTGYDTNPITGQPYATNVVPRGDFGRVLAEYWADGPKSETPPGHWNVVANEVSDELTGDLIPFATGAAVDRLSWDVHLYFALNGATHDAAITAWSVKRKFLASRPITIIRHMAELGQSSDPDGPSYDPNGLPIIEGVAELITDASSAPGERHNHLRRFIDQMAVRSWLGEPGSRANEVGGVGWLRAVDWVPYQRRNFVSPAFPGFVSGHSTFSRAAAEVLTAFTGSAYYPGGLGTFMANTNQYLVFEDGPSTAVQLQWATYYDAADQAGQSRLWGGIHIEPDDFVGRTLGHDGGLLAVTKARELFQRPE
jgi:hypothetical protein